MSRPVKHPQTGIYWFRKRVPDALRELVGKREEKISLRTRDPQVAKIEHARMAADVEARWRQLGAGVQTLTHRQVEAIAGEIYHSMVKAHEDNPDQVHGGRVGGLLWDRYFLGSTTVKVFPMGTDPEKTKLMIERLRSSRNAPRIDRWLGGRGLLLDAGSRAKLGAAVDKAVLQAREQLERMARGDYRPDPGGDRFPAFEPEKSKVDAGKRSPLRVFDDFAAEGEVKPGTVKRWRPIMAAVESEVPDIAGLTREWVVDWKDRLLQRGLDARSVRDVNLACLKATCEWAVSNGRMASNPVVGLKLKVRRKPRLREQGFTDEEAVRILSASLGSQPDRLSAHHRIARRWVSWLCAYTGARVGEIAQLRKEDVKQRDGIWLLWITPEAGTTKDGKPRWVAVHPALVKWGFIEFVAEARTGPLFYDPRQNRGGKTPLSERVGQHIATWVRKEVGISDRAIRPTHAWRHRFKTLAREVDMRPDAEAYMQGHAPATVGEQYGDHKAKALLREISKLPELALDGPAAEVSGGIAQAPMGV